MSLHWDKSAAHTDAFALIAEGWNEMVQEGHTRACNGVCPVTAEDDVVGVIAFRRVFPVFRVSLAYVEPSSRRKGVFKALLAEIRQNAIRTGHNGIHIWVSSNNSLAQTVLRRLDQPVSEVGYDLATRKG